MDELLREAFRHHIWANEQVIAFCRTLTPEQLAASAPGSYGSILATLNHLVAADAGYLPRTKVVRPDWAGNDRDIQDLEKLQARAQETAALWEAYLADPLDADHLLSLDQGAYEAQAAVPIVQALHHGNSHREQVCNVLTHLDVQPPDLQAWTWAEATGRARELQPPDA